MINLVRLAVVFSCLISLSFPLESNARPKSSSPLLKSREVQISGAWTFVKDPNNREVLPNEMAEWQPVSLPHTWNAQDPFNDVPGYYRGAGWYKTSIEIQPAWIGKELYLQFDGANQETEVFVNGKKAGSHIGGYSRFIIPITALVNHQASATQTIAVKVNNRFNKDIAPLSGDFTFFGGLYRKVSLLVLNPVHFDDSDFGSSGLQIATPEVSAANAILKVSGQLVNKSGSDKMLVLRSLIKDPQGRVISYDNFTLGQIKAGKRVEFIHRLQPISNPVLWSPEQPALYTITSSIVDAKTGVVLDVLQHKVGMRWFRFDVNEGFFLNGKSYKLMGTSRHQDYKGLGNAVPAALQVEDLRKIKAMGANFLRVAHYPQDQAVLNACDELGLLASVETPLVSEITESRAFTIHALRMQMEMIRQNYNHPSIIMWTYMNEILLKMKFKDDESRRKTYIENVRRLALALENTTRCADPYRYTMIPNHHNIKLYKEAGLTAIPMLVGWNVYQGWYGGDLADFPAVLDKLHKEVPNKPYMITEYGADADPRIHSFKPERFDKSVEYATRFHQTYLKAILEKPFVAGAQVWNFADFSSEDREETMPHINNKGLMTFDRKPKNTWYLYCAYLSKTPYLKLGVAEQEFRTGPGLKGQQLAMQQVDVFGNVGHAELFVNGKSIGTKSLKDHMASWDVPFHDGKNVLKLVSAESVKLEDQASISFSVIPAELNSRELPFRELAISLGDPRYFEEEGRHRVWLPDQPYRKGSWGYIGGVPYAKEDHGHQPFGTDKNIIGTSMNPIYQTQRIGLEGYKLDVPDGKYEVIMHFAELVGSEMTTVLPYNLLSSYKKAEKEARIFNIYLDGHLIANHLDLPNQFGPARAVRKKAMVMIKNNKGIYLQFKAIEGRPVLNALEVRRLE
jgi:beta-galactosidase